MENKKVRLLSESRKVTITSGNSTIISDYYNEDVNINGAVFSTSEEEGEYYDNRRKSHTSIASSIANSITSSTADGIGNIYVPKNDRNLFQILANLASNDQLTRFEAFKRFVHNPANYWEIRSKVFTRILEDEISKTRTGPLVIRLLALECIGALKDLEVESFNGLVRKLLRMSYDDASHLIRSKAILALESLISQNSIKWTKSISIKKNTENGNESSSSISGFDVLEKLPSSLSFPEAIFLVLSYSAANDTHMQTRLVAMEAIGRIPFKGTVRSEILLLQSVKKDQLRGVKIGAPKKGGSKSSASHSGSSNNTSTGGAIISDSPPSKNENTCTCIPLLCCGVFAHGIEDQFVKIRLASLVSLYSLASGINETVGEFGSVISVFLDALLDECDLIRLAALKFINNLGPINLTVKNGLESLLAVLDDQNKEIRSESLKIIANNLVLSRTFDSSVNEVLLRSQRCLEAVIQKYPEMEFQVMETGLRFMIRSAEVIKNGAFSESNFLCNLMEASLPEFMTPASLLPFTSTICSLSAVQSVMQIPFLGDEKQRLRRLVKIITRIQDGTSDQKLGLLNDSRGEDTPASSISLTLTGDKSVDLFKMRVRNRNNLSARCKIDSKYNPANLAFYHFETDRPVAYFKVKRLQVLRDKVIIDDFELIGPIKKVKLAVYFGEKDRPRSAANVPIPFVLKYGGTKFVASRPEKNNNFDDTLTIVHGMDMNSIVYKQQ